jgi:hypothetical protein
MSTFSSSPAMQDHAPITTASLRHLADPDVQRTAPDTAELSGVLAWSRMHDIDGYIR